MDEWTLNDLLECSVCLERLDTSSKVLPCQHTFCRKCLEEIVHRYKQLQCPECRVLVEINIDELPPNVLLMRILEGLKNAPRKISGTTHSYYSEKVTANHSKSIVSTLNSNVRVRSRSASRPEPQQILDLRQPYAIAKCDYVSKEPGDLRFKKGDVILLRRRIDHNWYQGECNGVLGVFPLSYVQVIVPLPSQIPQCKAIYDFGKCHEDDEGCLHFSKGDVLTVTRRIDKNWVEGKLDNRIGIFPISFVEMNHHAKNLMKSTCNFDGLSREAPPTPTDESTPLICNDESTFVSTQNVAESHATPLSPSFSSSSTSTIATSTSSSESIFSLPSLSPSSGTASSQPLHVKRHSYTVGAQPPPYHAPPVVHRHSVEILKSENSSIQCANAEQPYRVDTRSPQKKPHDQSCYPTPLEETSSRQPGHSRKHHELVELNRAKQLQTIGNSSFQRQNSLRISKSSFNHSNLSDPPTLPALYFAIYPYKPQKADELELITGSVYTVTERCQDGWFKGTSHPNQKCGVFPGNYVASVNALHMLQAQVIGLVQNTASAKPENRVSSDVRISISHTKSNSTVTSSASSNNDGSARIALPELPARSLSPSSSTPSPKVSTITLRVPTADVLEKSSSLPLSSNKSRQRSSKNETCVASVAPNSGQKLNDFAGFKSCEKNKMRKEKASVNLIKRLTSIKKSRSPPPSTLCSVDNPVFEDGTSSTFVPVAHARSDSCPSQLSYNIQTQATSSINHLTNIVGGSQRIKHKQRSSLQNQFARTFEDNSSSAFSPHVKTSKDEKLVISHRKSSSLDATVYEERESRNRSSDHFKTEKYRCIAPYPPISEFELDLVVGDVIYVHKKRDDGWYKGTLKRNGRTGLFPASFVESL